MSKDFKLEAARLITSSAEAKSQGDCARYCRAAIQEAKGIPVGPTGINSAKDFGGWLKKLGYSEKSNQSISSVEPGNVIIIDAVGKHEHGHIAIYCSDGRWRSDFVQKSYNPFIGIDASDIEYTLYE